MDKHLRVASIFLCGLALVILFVLAAILWWGGDADSRIRRLIYTPQGSLHSWEMFSMFSLSEAQRAEFSRHVALKLPTWCPEQCGDWVRDEHDVHTLLQMLYYASYSRPDICADSVRVASHYLHDEAPVVKAALDVWSHCGTSAEYRQLYAIQYASPELQSWRQGALDGIARRMTPDNVTTMVESLR